MKSRRLGSGINRTEPIVYVFYVIVILVSLLCLLPFWLVVIGSLSSESDILKYGYALWPRNWSLAAYEMVFNIPGRIIQAYKVSIIITFVGTFISLVFSSMAAFVLMRKDFVYRNKIAMFLYFPSIFSGGMLPSYLLITKYLGLKDNIWALILPGMISAWNIFLLRNFMTDIPDSIAESAKIDGANDFQIFTKFYLPLSKAGLATIGLFLTFGYWNDWFQSSLYISRAELVSLQALLNNMMKSLDYIANNPSAGLSLQQYRNSMPSESVRMAIAIVIVIPIACAYPFFQKYFISGLTIGAVKG